MKPTVRAIATYIIADVEKGYSLTKLLKKTNMQKIIDGALLKQLCYGTIRHYFSLQEICDLMLRKPIKPEDSIIKTLILVGIYQLRYLRIPAHAIISETVETTKYFKKIQYKGLVNAILRNMQRLQQANHEYSFSLSATYDHPEWLINIFRRSWPKYWQNIIQANNCQPPMTIRINQKKHTRETYIQYLDNKLFSLTQYSKWGITLTKSCKVTDLPGFNQGWVSVQDEASQLCANLLQCQPNMRVLDACAAPGGKTCHILEQTDNLELWAIDINKPRLSQLKNNLERLNLHAKLICADVSVLNSWWDNKPFDRILLDPPCSGTGVIRRHPDIKLLRLPEDVDKFVLLQWQLLQKLWTLLTPTGIMVYATCSILPQENQEQIQKFLQANKDAKLLPISQYPEAIDNNGLQLLPSIQAHDGFFYSVLQKNQ